MAVHGNYNLDQALNSQAYAYKCWYSYNYGNNTMGISANDMNKITQNWSGELSNWRATAENDENAYEIEDDEINTAKKEGVENVKENTGYDGDNSTDKAVGTTGGVVACVGAVMGAVLSIVGFINKVGSSAGFFKSIYTTAATGLALMASAIALKCAAPNKEGAEACDKLTQTELPAAQTGLAEAQSTMEDANSTIEDYFDEAETYNEDANEQMEEDKTSFDIHKRTYELLMAKVEAGEPLSEDEKTLLKDVVDLMKEAGILLSETTEETTEAVQDIYDAMGEEQEKYDMAAETVAEVQGVTEWAKEFDESTAKNANFVKIASIVGEGAAAGIVTAGTRAVITGGLNPARYVAGGVAIASGVTSGIFLGMVASQQNGFKQTAETEIEARKATEEINTTTNEAYAENIDVYAGQMAGVEDLELLIPDDMEAPEEVPPTTPAGDGTTPTGGAATPNATPTTGGTSSTDNSSGTNAENNEVKKNKENEK